MAISLPNVVQTIVTKVDTKGLDTASTKMGRFAGQATDVGKKMSMGLTAPVVGLGLTFLKIGAGYEFSMNRVKAVTQATEADFMALDKVAQELGRTTQFSAKQAADGMSFLAMAGFDTNQIIGSMPAVLDLAAAGQMDLATAADVASNILTGFGLETDMLGGTIDAMTATFVNSNTSLGQLGEAMKFIAPVAASAGQEFNQISAAVGLLGNAGIQASMAGTTLRGAISKLLAPTNESEQALKRLGITVLDNEGNMLPFLEIVRQFESAGLKTADAMTIFGLRAGPGMAALVSQGSGALEDMIEKLDNSAGLSKQIAETQMEGLNGALLRLKSAFEGMAIAIANSGLLEFATNIVIKLTGVIQSVANLDPKILKLGLVFAGLVAAAGPAILIMGKLAFAMNQIKVAKMGADAAGAAGGIAKMGRAAKLTAVSMGAISLALVIALPLIIKFINSKSDQEKAVEGVTEKLKTENGVLDLSIAKTREWINETSRFNARNQIDDLERLGISYAAMSRQLADGTDGLRLFADQAMGAGEISREFKDVIDALTSGMGVTEEQSFALADGNAFLAQEIKRVADSGTLTAGQMKSLIDYGGDLFGTNADLIESFALEQQAIEAVGAESINLLFVDGQLSKAQAEMITNLHGSSDAFDTWAKTSQFAGLVVDENRIAAHLLGISVEELTERIAAQEQAEFDAMVASRAYLQSINGLSEGEIALGQVTSDTARQQAEMEGVLRDTLRATGLSEAAIDDLIASMDDKEVEEFAASIEEVATEADIAAEELASFSKALDDALGVSLSAEAATDALSASIREAREAFDEAVGPGENFSFALNSNTEEGEDLREMARGLIEDVIGVSEAQETAEGKTAELISGLINLKDQFPELADRIDGHISDLGEIPPEVATLLQADPTLAHADLEALGIFLDEYPEKHNPTITTIADSSEAKRALENEGPNFRRIGSGLGGDLMGGMDAGFGGLSALIAGRVNRSLASANTAVRRAQGIKSPSRVWAKDIGEPMALGIAMGVKDEAGEITKEALDAVKDAARDVSRQIDSVFSGISAGRGSGDAKRNLKDAQRDLADAQTRGIEDAERDIADAQRAHTDAQTDLGKAEAELARVRRESGDLPEKLAEAERLLNMEKAQAEQVSLKEAVAVERSENALQKARAAYVDGSISLNEYMLKESEHEDLLATVTGATSGVEDAQDHLNDVLASGAEMTDMLKDAERDVEDAHRDVGDAARDVEDADRGLEDANRDVEDATRAVEDAQLDVVDAERELQTAGQELVDAGPDAVDYFKTLATEAGLTEDQIDNLITKYGNLATAAAPNHTIPDIIADPAPSADNKPKPSATTTKDTDGTFSTGPALQQGQAGGGEFGSLPVSALSKAEAELARIRRESVTALNFDDLFPNGLASGGTVTGPIRTMVGEGPSPELILPLEDARGVHMLSRALEAAGLGGGGGTEVNIEVNNPTAEPASMSVSREMRVLVETGAFG